MKSTQDLAMFLKCLSENRKKQVTIMIYPDKSFILYEAEGMELEIIYSSSEVSDALDINDLPYEDAMYFSVHIDELASVQELVGEATILANKDKYVDL